MTKRFGGSTLGVLTGAHILLWCLLVPGRAFAQAPAIIAEGSSALSRGAPLPGWVDVVEAPPRGPGGAAVVMHFADTHFRVDPQPVVFTHRVMEATETSALNSLGQFPIVFQPEYQRVELHLLRIRRDEGVIDKLHSAQIRFVQREQEIGSGIYRGAVTAVIVTDDLRRGDLPEVAYSIVGQNPVLSGKFADAAFWDTHIPLHWRRVTIDADERRQIHYRMIGAAPGAEIKPVERRANGRTRLRFEARALAAVDNEPYIASGVQPLRWIQFSEFATWSEVSNWAAELFEPTAPRGALEPALAKLRSVRNRREAVVRALEFVQDEVRYLSISLGENSHRPYPPAEVLARRYGDCKDKTLLLITLLRALGIEASPALVSVQDRQGLDALLPSPLVFDHVIVRVTLDGETFYLDPTLSGQGARLEKLGQFHAGVQTLVVSAKAGSLGTIPRSEESRPSSTRVERVKAERLDEPVRMVVELRYRGLQAESVRRQMAALSAEQLHKAYEAELERRYPEARMTAPPRIADDRDENVIRIDLGYSIPKFFTRERNDWVLRYHASNFRDMFFVPDSGRRRFPLQVPTADLVTSYDFELKLPEEYDARRRPEQRKLASDAFGLKESLSFTGSIAKASLELSVHSDRVAPEKVAAFMADVRKANEMSSGYFVIAPHDLKRAAPAIPAKQALAERLEEMVRATSRTIADARIASRDASLALCERSRALAYLGREAEALADIHAVARMQAATAEVARCSGEVHFVLGQFERSASELSRVLVLGARDAEVHFRRGLAYYYGGRVSEAAEDFGQSADQAGDARERVRARIWHALALRTGKGASPAAQAVPASARAEPEWPGPALALFGPGHSPDELLRTVHKAAGDELETTLAEAYLYVGQYYLLGGDRIKAAVYLRRAIDKGVVSAFFHSSARHELARLAAGER